MSGDSSRHHAAKCNLYSFSEHPRKSYVSAPVHSHDQHIHIVETTLTAEGQNIVLLFDEAFDRFPGIEDVPRGTPHVRPRGADPFMSFVRAPAATAEQNIPPAVCEGEPHAAIEHFSVCEIGLEAVIVFEKIDAPFREGRRRLRIHDYNLRGTSRRSSCRSRNTFRI